MTWTATLKGITQGEVSWSFVVIYSDGQETIVKQYTAQALSDSIIESTAQNEVAGFNAVQAAAGKIGYTPGAQINLTPVPPSPPTDAQVAEAKFLSDWDSLQALNRAVMAGFIQSDDPRIEPLQKSLESEWLDSYIGMI